MALLMIRPSIPPRRTVAFVLFSALIATGLYVAVAHRPFGLDLSQDGLMRWIESLGHWGGAGIILLMIAHSFIPFPAEIVAFISGEFFGLFWGTIYAWSGAMSGAILAFVLARTLGHEAIQSLLPGNYEDRLINWSVTRTANAMLLARFIPLIAFNLINYVAGLTRISWWTFIWTTSIGILPLTILFVYLGEQMRGASWREWAAMAFAALIIWVLSHLVVKALQGNNKP